MKKILIAFILFGIVGAQGDVVVRIGLDGVVAAGKQRGDLFHMLGYYVQLLTRQSYHYPKENLQKDIHEYESILAQLDEVFPQDEIQAILAHSQKIWKATEQELLETAKKGSTKTLETSRVQALMRRVASLSNDMKKIQEILTSDSLDKKIALESHAAADIMESSAQLSAYYLINTSSLGKIVDQATIDKSNEAYQHAFEKLENSAFRQGKIFQKRLKGFKKIFYFNTMTAEFSKTAVPALMIKKNNKAYLDALVTLKLIVAASTEGTDKTVKMFFK